MIRSLKIIFFGTPDFAVESLDSIYKSKHKLLCVVTSNDKKSGRGMKINLSAVKKYSSLNEIKILQTEDFKNDNFLNTLKTYDADLFIVVAFKFLPKEIWSIPKLGTINIHASLLPNLRGAAPINWALINGLKETGLTSFFINEKIDYGDIILQEKLKIQQKDNFESLYKKLKDLSGKFILKSIDCILDKGHNLKKQNSSKKYLIAPKLNRENTRINWNKSAESIYNFVRGLSPVPCAWTLEKKTNKKILIYDVDFNTKSNDQKNGVKILSELKTLSISTSKGSIIIKSLKIEGKRVISGKDYLNANINDQIIFI